MSTDALVEILARETQKFTQLMAAKNYSHEYMECKEIIQMVQEVLEGRKALSGQTQDNVNSAHKSSS